MRGVLIHVRLNGARCPLSLASCQRQHKTGGSGAGWAGGGGWDIGGLSGLERAQPVEPLTWGFVPNPNQLIEWATSQGLLVQSGGKVFLWGTQVHGAKITFSKMLQ